MKRAAVVAIPVVALLFLAACSGDDGSGPAPPPPDLAGELAYISGGLIVVRNFTDGSTRRIALSTDGVVVNGLAWQPDGAALVYAPYLVGGPYYELHRVPVDGSPETVLYPADEHQAWPAFAADGRLGYWVNGLEHDYTMFVDGQPFSSFDGTCPPSRPTWSPDGSAMLVVERADGADRLVRVTLATGAAVVVFQAAGDENAEQLVNPAYSHSGDRVAFTRSVFGPNNSETDEIWLINADGSNPSRLTSGHHDQEPTWSPDDGWIAFARNDESASPTGLIIDVISSAGGSVTRLSEGDGFAPAWR